MNIECECQLSVGKRDMPMSLGANQREAEDSECQL